MHVAVSTPPTATQVLVALSDGPVVVDDTAPFEMDVPIPQQSLGAMTIGALAWDTNGIIGTATTTVSVTTTATVTTLKVWPDSVLYLIQAETVPFVVHGIFSDGIERDITTNQRGTTYNTTDSSVASIDTAGLLTAKAAGYCSVIVSNGDSMQIPVLVQAPSHRSLYFPHIASHIGDWETEICVINTSSTQTINGVFKAYSDAGVLVSEIDVIDLAPNGRREITVGDEFTSPANIGYIVFESNSSAVVGYTKFYVEGQYRVAVPAVSDTEINTGDIYISHIASGGEINWYTGVSLLNTTSSPKTLTIEFDNGQTKSVSLAANEHKAFTIRSLFGGTAQPGIQSGVIKDAGGVIGLELFPNNDLNWMSGILLKDDTATSIYYPHTVSGGGWSTGIVAYNPSDTSCDMTITPYTAAGIPLSTTVVPIGGKKKYIGLVSAFGLPVDTAWFQIEATSPITGFELFARTDLLGGYTSVGISGREGVFAKIEKDGYTMIAFVNTGETTASILLTAYDDNGNAIATETVALAGHARIVNTASNLFSQDISGATYIAYSSDLNLSGFQLNTSSDGMMLDGLPGM